MRRRPVRASIRLVALVLITWTGLSAATPYHAVPSVTASASAAQAGQLTPIDVPAGAVVPLGELRQPSGKIITLWALEADLDPAMIVPGSFTMEWPKGSGQMAEFPEIDRAAWFDLETAARKLVAGQVPFLDRLVEALADG